MKKKKSKFEEEKKYFEFLSMVDDSIDKDKKGVVKKIMKHGDDLLEEISEKKKRKKKEKREMIKYILEKNPKKYSKSDLSKNYSHEEILEIYNVIKRKNKPFVQKVKELLTPKK